jgi:pyridoxine 5-phosphate synthase
MKPLRLSINVDHVATLRQARGGLEPDPVECASICEDHGADGITVHLREDRRHIRDRDVAALRDVVRGCFNLEMALNESVTGVARSILPDQVTLVPEKREELTTEGGLDVLKHREIIRTFIEEFHGYDVKVSLFVEPERDIMEAGRDCGADIVEIHTGTYCNLRDEEREKEKARIFEAAQHARSLGLHVHAGHGLNYENLSPLLDMPGLEEMSIGHSIISRAVITGIGPAVEEMLTVMERKPSQEES